MHLYVSSFPVPKTAKLSDGFNLTYPNTGIFFEKWLQILLPNNYRKFLVTGTFW
jgi:hypothetical protein